MLFSYCDHFRKLDRRFACPWLKEKALLMMMGCVLLGLICCAMVISCKPRGTEALTVDLNSSQLKSMVDDKYILFVSRIATASPSDPPNYGPQVPQASDEPESDVFEFISCSLELPVASGQYVGKAVRLRLNVGGWSAQPYEFAVIEETCTPTYVDEDGYSMTFTTHDLFEEVYNAREIMEQQKNQIDRQQGTHFLAAFGWGATFHAFTAPVRSAVISLLPARLVNTPYFAFASQVSLATAAGSHPSSRIWDLEKREEYSVVLPVDTEAGEKNELSTADKLGMAPSVLTSYGISHILIQSASNAGPLGTIGSYTIIPFLVSVLLSIKTNHANDIQKNFQEILAIHQVDPGGSVASSSDRHSPTSSIPEVSRLLGEVLGLSGWVSEDQLRQYCIPASEAGGQPTCHTLTRVVAASSAS